MRNSRRYDIWFDHTWSEVDDITIELPKGYSAESVEQPPGVSDAQGNASLKIEYQFAADKSSLKYSRSFSFGNKAILEFNQERYKALKLLFDSFHRSETEGITFIIDAR